MSDALLAIIFLAGVALSLDASWILIARIERVGARFGLSEALLGMLAALAARRAGDHRGSDGHRAPRPAHRRRRRDRLQRLQPGGAARAVRRRRRPDRPAPQGDRDERRDRRVDRPGLPVGGARRDHPADRAAGGAGGDGPLRGDPRHRPRPTRAPAASARLGALARGGGERGGARAGGGDPPGAAEGRATACWRCCAVLVVVAASIAHGADRLQLGARAGVPEIVVGGLVLAAVTSLPNAVAAVYLAARARRRGGAEHSAQQQCPQRHRRAFHPGGDRRPRRAFWRDGRSLRRATSA